MDRLYYDSIFGASKYKNIPANLVLGRDWDNNVFISILMPTFNHPDFLKEAVLSCLNQDFGINFEIVIVDNNHNDYQKRNQSIIENINSSKIRYYVNEENVGYIENWNRCVALSHGEYITFCHDDDKLLPNALSLLYNCLKNTHIGTEMIIGPYNVINSNSEIVRDYRTRGRNKYRKYSLFESFIGNVTNGCGSLYHKKSFLDLGGFNAEYDPCCDYEINVQYIMNHGAVILSEPTFNYRVSETNGSASVYNGIPDMNLKIREGLMCYLNKYNSYLIILSECIYIRDVYSNKKKWEGALTICQYLKYIIANAFVLTAYIPIAFRKYLSVN